MRPPTMMQACAESVPLHTSWSKHEHNYCELAHSDAILCVRACVDRASSHTRGCIKVGIPVVSPPTAMPNRLLIDEMGDLQGLEGSGGLVIPVKKCACVCTFNIWTQLCSRLRPDPEGALVQGRLVNPV